LRRYYEPVKTRTLIFGLSSSGVNRAICEDIGKGGGELWAKVGDGMKG
jgi:hypothetical protein